MTFKITFSNNVYRTYTNQSEFGTGGKYTRAIQAVTAFTQGMMGNNIVTAIANGSAPYLANEVKNQIQGNSVESDIQRTLIFANHPL
ncbi:MULTISPECIES: hypothetical protein [Proteus]|uniref:hypothetical protein n=1 Tax=Proteus TaxID=583 RepID=UPI001376748F|nr:MULTISPECIES: hypothetical protein [unclassified Proteus (in: enterobacteria)]NBL76276.1 hypothetical protein [Proteus sp. G2672]NBM58807.1 hypothetical protein [Proteus sp. G2667]